MIENLTTLTHNKNRANTPRFFVMIKSDKVTFPV